MATASECTPYLWRDSSYFVTESETCDYFGLTETQYSHNVAQEKETVAADKMPTPCHNEKQMEIDENLSGSQNQVNQPPEKQLDEIETGTEDESETEGSSSDDDDNKDDDGEEEGGWITDEECVAEQKSTQQEDSDCDEMFDLFGDNTTIDYDDDIANEDCSDADNDLKCVVSSVRPTPALPPRTYYSCTNPRKSAKRPRYERSGASSVVVSDYQSNLSEWCDNSAFEVRSNKAHNVRRSGYAFPRIEPDDISEVVDFWEMDFEVNRRIIPRMSSWESLGLVPSQNKNVFDYNKYMMYKVLYRKWVQCHECKEQWYRKYGLRSLYQILYMRTSYTKLYPEECVPIKGLQRKLERLEKIYGSLEGSLGKPSISTGARPHPSYSCAATIASMSNETLESKMTIYGVR